MKLGLLVTWLLVVKTAQLLAVSVTPRYCGRNRKLGDDGRCEPCDKCSRGEGYPKGCGYGLGAGDVCENCIEGKTFNDGNTGNKCQPCRDCQRLHRAVKFRCRLTENSVCGPCQPGFWDSQADRSDSKRYEYACSPCLTNSSHKDCDKWRNDTAMTRPPFLAAVTADVVHGDMAVSEAPSRYLAWTPVVPAILSLVCLVLVAAVVGYPTIRYFKKRQNNNSHLPRTGHCQPTALKNKEGDVAASEHLIPRHEEAALLKVNSSEPVHDVTPTREAHLGEPPVLPHALCMPTAPVKLSESLEGEDMQATVVLRRNLDDLSVPCLTTDTESLQTRHTKGLPGPAADCTQGWNARRVDGRERPAQRYRQDVPHLLQPWSQATTLPVREPSPPAHNNIHPDSLQLSISDNIGVDGEQALHTSHTTLKPAYKRPEVHTDRHSLASVQTSSNVPLQPQQRAPSQPDSTQPLQPAVQHQRHQVANGGCPAACRSEEILEAEDAALHRDELKHTEDMEKYKQALTRCKGHVTDEIPTDVQEAMGRQLSCKRALAGDQNFLHTGQDLGLDKSVLENLSSPNDFFELLKRKQETIARLLTSLHTRHRHDVVNLLSDWVLRHYGNDVPCAETGDPDVSSYACVVAVEESLLTPVQACPDRV